MKFSAGSENCEEFGLLRPFSTWWHSSNLIKKQDEVQRSSLEMESREKKEGQSHSNNLQRQFLKGARDLKLTTKGFK